MYLDAERALLCEVGRWVYDKGWVASNDGNLSLRVDSDRFLITPSGVSKGFITPDSILLVNCAGEIIQGSGRASSEWSTHYKVYEQRADIGAVIHSHAPFATAFAVAGLALDLPVLPEMVYSLGAVPLVPYHLPGSNKLSEAIEPFVTRVNALLLKNHGVVTYGADLKEAFFCHESVEHAARIQIYAKLLGNIEVFNREEVAELKALRDQGGLTSPWYPVQV